MKRVSLLWWLIVASLPVVPTLTNAQQLVPAGSVKLDPHLALPSETKFQVSISAYQKPEVVGQLTERYEAANLEGVSVLIKNGSQNGAENYTERLVMDAATLRPRSYHLESSNQTIDVRYEGLHVSGLVTPKGKEPRKIDQTLDKPRYAGNSFFLILRSLDISRTLNVEVPFFRIFDLKPLEVTFRTVSADNLELPNGNKVAVWLIEGQIDSARALYWIRKDNHELMKVVTFGEGGFEFRLTPNI